MENKEKIENSYSWKNGKRVVSRELKTKKLNTRLKQLGITTVDTKLIESVKGVDPNQNLYIVTYERDQAKINGVIAYLWCKLGIDRSFRIMNAYELVEIYLGKREDDRSLLDLKSSMLVLLYGYEEMENRRQPDFILQVYENRRRLGLKTWFLNLGNKCKLELVHNYMIKNEFKMIDLSGGEVEGILSL